MRLLFTMKDTLAGGFERGIGPLPASVYIFITALPLLISRKSFLMAYLPSRYSAVLAVAATAAAVTIHKYQVSFCLSPLC